MAGSIKLFLKLRNDVYKTMGICLGRNSQRFVFNFQNIFFLVCLAQMVASVTVYACVHATSMEEYGIVFFADITLLDAIIHFCLLIWNGPQIFQLIEHLEQFIEMSKLQKHMIPKSLKKFGTKT